MKRRDFESSRNFKQDDSQRPGQVGKPADEGIQGGRFSRYGSVWVGRI